MHEVNFLGKYLPEFGKLTCLVQHEFYHQYAADEHTLVCIEQLDKIWEAQQPPYKSYAPLFQHLARPGLLYLALLLHDVGKSAHDKKEGHSTVSAEMAMRAAKRLHLDDSASHVLRILIENHLTMAVVSQRRDLDDDSVIRDFAHTIESEELLNSLTLLTFADSEGTSDKLWNGFKDSLLWQLHSRTMVLLSAGMEFIRAEEQRVETLLKEVRELAPDEIADDEIVAHFSNLPLRYFQIRAAKEVFDDITLAHRFMRQLIEARGRELSPVIACHDEPDRGYSSIKVCTWDRAGLFSKIAGTLSAAEMNILSAQILTRTDGIALDTFLVQEARTGGPATLQQYEKFSALLEKVLAAEAVDLPALIARSMTKPVYQAYAGERMATRIHFDNQISETRTVIEVETEDHLGLLYTISQTFAKLGVDIAAARILTERGAAIDSFYVRESDGGKVESPSRRILIEKNLREAISRLDV